MNLSCNSNKKKPEQEEKGVVCLAGNLFRSTYPVYLEQKKKKSG
jgi:hypothetical protein